MRYRFRILRVIAAAEFKLKYADSALGYLWSVLKPLALFTVLYIVFGRILKLGSVSNYYAVSLLMGIVVFSFFAEATAAGMYSLVAREALLRKLIFPRMIVPAAATMTAAMTFCANAIVVGGFVAAKGVAPRLDWLLIIPLLLELYVFVLGIALLLSSAFVRLRDIGQVWELVTQLVFYATPVLYPVGYLPAEARRIAFVNPLAQILQDLRAIVLYPDLRPNRLTVADAFGEWGRLIPIGVVLLILVLGVAVFRREEARLGERL